MHKFRLLALAAIVIVATAALALRSTPALAHEGHTVGPYSVELGWRVEPAFVGLPNGPELFISSKDDETKKIEGAEKTLKLDVTFGKETRPVKIGAAYGDPGHYVADLIPTRAGDYVYHLTGTIGDTKVDETYTSASGKFGTVEPVADVLFPDTNFDVGSLIEKIDAQQKQIDALKADIDALKAAKK
jgi:hypothetical protein